MRKSKDRSKIESLAIGRGKSFPKTEYVRICRIVVDMNKSDRAKGHIKPDDIRYRIDSDINPGKVTVVRDL